MSKRIKALNREKYNKELIELINNNDDFMLEKITDYCKRIIRKQDGARIDFFISSRKFHNIETGERGMCEVKEVLDQF